MDEAQSQAAPPFKYNRLQKRGKAALKFRPNLRERNEPIYRLNGDEVGGYRILHPTKGWRTMTQRRLQAIDITLAKSQGKIAWWRGCPVLERRVAHVGS